MRIKAKIKSIFIFFIFLMIIGCGTADIELDLIYRNLENVQTYLLEYMDNVALDMGGQPMNAVKEFEITFSEKMKSNKNQQGIHSIITHKKVAASMTMAQGKQMIDTRNMTGKEMEMYRSPKGDTLTFTDRNNIPKINLSMMAGGPVGLDFFLENYSPVLPAENIKKGESWAVQKNRFQIAGSLPVNGMIETTHNLVGFENINGYECAKIESRSIGKLSGEAEQMGMLWTYNGIFEDEATWYFAFKKGLLIKASFAEHTKGTFETAGDNATSYPVEHNTTVEFKLLSE